MAACSRYVYVLCEGGAVGSVKSPMRVGFMSLGRLTSTHPLSYHLLSIVWLLQPRPGGGVLCARHQRRQRLDGDGAAGGQLGGGRPAGDVRHQGRQASFLSLLYDVDSTCVSKASLGMSKRPCAHQPTYFASQPTLVHSSAMQTADGWYTAVRDWSNCDV